jgi:hypothetical protein
MPIGAPIVPIENAPLPPDQNAMPLPGGPAEAAPAPAETTNDASGGNVPPQPAADSEASARQKPAAVQTSSDVNSNGAATATTVEHAEGLAAPSADTTPAGEFESPAATASGATPALEAAEQASTTSPNDASDAASDWEVEFPESSLPAEGSHETGQSATTQDPERPREQAAEMPDWSLESAHSESATVGSKDAEAAETSDSPGQANEQSAKEADLTSATDAEFWADGAASTAQDDIEFGSPIQQTEGKAPRKTHGDAELIPAGVNSLEPAGKPSAAGRAPGLLPAQAAPRVTSQPQGQPTYRPVPPRTPLQKIWSSLGGRETHRVPTNIHNVQPDWVKDGDAGRVRLEPDETGRVNLNGTIGE